MSKSFPTIASTEIDGESPVTVELVGKFWDREESLISCPIDTRFALATRGAAGFAQVKTVRLWLPAYVATAGGAVTLVFVFEARTSTSGTTGNVRARLGASGAYQTTASISSQSFAYFTLTIPASEVAAAADSEKDLEIEADRTAGTGNVEVKCESTASRFERAA